MKKLILAMLIALAIGLVGAPAVWAGETVTGKITGMETDEGALALTIATDDGKSVILQADPAQVESLQLKQGDAVQVTAEGKHVKSIKKL